MNSNEDFLRNELIWLASIRCEIIENDSYIIVKNKTINTEDFNFLFLKKIIDERKLIRIMKNHHLQFLKVTENIDQVYVNFIKLSTTDINYVANYNKKALDFLRKKVMAYIYHQKKSGLPYFYKKDYSQKILFRTISIWVMIL